MKKTAAWCAALIVAMTIISVPGIQAEGRAIGLSAGLDYFSNYFWRGVDYYGENRGVIFPFVNLELGQTGLSLGYLGEYSSEVAGDGATDSDKLWYGADFGIGFSYTIAEAVTIGAKVWYYWYYNSVDQNKKINANDHDESFATGTVSLAVDALPLTPTIIYNHDYYIDDYEGTRETDEDFYVQFQLSHAFQLTAEAALKLTAGIAYYNQATAELENDPSSKKKKGISDVTAAADISVTVGGATIHGSLNYAYVPDEDWYRDATTGIANKHHWWSGFGASYAL